MMLDHILAQIRDALERDDLISAANIIEAMRPADQAELFAELDEDQQVALLSEIAPADSADIFEEMDDEAVVELIASLSNEDLLSIVDEMEPDEAADLLGDMTPERAQLMLLGLEDAEEVRPLMIHPDESAGGLMTTEFLVLRRRMTVAEAIEAFRQWQPGADVLYHLYIVDQFGILCGAVNLRELVISPADALIMDIMDTEVVSVQAGVDQEEAAQILNRYDLLALPVVNATGLLLGVITVDDVLDVLVEEATEDMQRMGGSQPLERSYLDTAPVIITRKRIGWLLLLFVGGTLTGSVMRLFENELQTMVMLSVFIPLLVGTGGNAGSQTIATIIQALATKDIEPREAFWVWWHEVRVGLLLGLGMAIAAFIRAITWDPNPALALTVSISIMALVLWATSVGSLLPLIAARTGLDPALVSGPLMSTLVDATGLFIYFTIARLILGL